MQPFGQQGVYNNMSITVSMAGGSGGVGSLPPIGQPVGMSNSNLSSVGSVCSDQQVSDREPPGLCFLTTNLHLSFAMLYKYH